MGVVLVTVVLAVLVGRGLGGRVARLEHVRYRDLRLLVAAATAAALGTLLAVAGLPARLTHGLGLAAGAALVLGFCVRNRAVPGTGLIGAGLLLNAIAIGANGGMPVSAGAAARAGLPAAAATAGPLHVPAGPGTRFPALADRVPVPLPVRPEVVSIGDLLVAAGLAQLVVAAMRPARPGAAPAVPAPGTAPAPPAPADRPARPDAAADTPWRGNVRVLPAAARRDRSNRSAADLAPPTGGQPTEPGGAT